MGRRNQGVILDLYGTLAYLPVDTYARAKERMAAICGCNRTAFFDAWRNLTTASHTGELATTEDRVRETLRLVGRLSIADHDVRRMVEIEEELQEEAIRLIPGVPDMLEDLRAMGLRLALASNCSSSAAKVPEKLGIADHFDALLLSYQLHVVKPDPRIYLRACQHLALAPSDVLFAGDGDCHELDGAQAVGMIAVLVRGVETLTLQVEESRSYDYAVVSINQLPQLIKQLNVAA